MAKEKKKKLPKKGSKEWQATNKDSPEVPKKWLHDRWYKGQANPVTGEKLIITSHAVTDAYRDGWDLIWGNKDKKNDEELLMKPDSKDSENSNNG